MDRARGAQNASVGAAIVTSGRDDLVLGDEDGLPGTEPRLLDQSGISWERRIGFALEGVEQRS